MGGQDDGAQAEEVGAGPGPDGGRVGGRHGEVHEGGEGDGLGESAYVAIQPGMGKEGLLAGWCRWKRRRRGLKLELGTGALAMSA